jgi:hypothetical protein
MNLCSACITSIFNHAGRAYADAVLIGYLAVSVTLQTTGGCGILTRRCTASIIIKTDDLQGPMLRR